jgi:hypothetical protein
MSISELKALQSIGQVTPEKGPDPIVNASVIPPEFFLEEASNAMKARAALRDTPEGERTASKIANVFNSLTGRDISESEAWLFLVVLKLVRGMAGKFHADDYVDAAAYIGLLGSHESAIR